QPAVEGVTEVSFNLRGPSGQKVANKLFIKQVKGNWRVVDVQAGEAPLVASLKQGYATVRTKITPVQYLHILFDVVIKNAKGASTRATSGATSAPASQPAR